MHVDLTHTPDGPRFNLRTLFALMTGFCVLFAITSMLKMPMEHLPLALAVCAFVAWVTIRLFGLRRRFPPAGQDDDGSPLDAALRRVR